MTAIITENRIPTGSPSFEGLMDLFKELSEFLNGLKMYSEALKDPNTIFSKDRNNIFGGLPFIQELTSSKTKEELIEQLREGLIRKNARLSKKIIELTGKQHFTQFGTTHDMWVSSLSTVFHPGISRSSIAQCIDATNEAIGLLETEGESWGIASRHTKDRKKSPKAFISHGKEGGALLKLEKFLKELGIQPILVKDQPNLDRTVSKKVEDYLGEADFVIILATGDDKVEGKMQPRPNVIHEIGLAQKTHAGKIIYLLENGAEFPSNIKPKVYESFARQSMDEAFIAIVREISKLGFL